MRKIISLVLAAVALAACKNGNHGDGAAGGAAQTKSTQFVAFGDAGTGSERQIAVGEAMAEVCRRRGCEFALELGDNFYLSGVSSVDDEQFQSKFETPYKNLKVPVYVVLGNHDNSLGPGEGSDNSKGEHQVDYHYLAGRNSDKWRMPARYYNFTAPLSGGAPLAEFFALDSNPLTAILPDLNPQWNFVTYGAEQQSWLSAALKASRARWKIALAHHPYISNGLHGNAGSYDGTNPLLPITTSGKPWKDLLEATVCAEGVDLFLQGHDHDLEWLKPVSSCGKTHFIVSGAAEGPRPFGDAARNPSYWQVDNTLGFFWFKLDGDRFTAAAYTLDASMKLPKDAQGRALPAFEQTVVREP
ncbi:MAG: metallophosphoesterase [Nevskiales bacterium]